MPGKTLFKSYHLLKWSLITAFLLAFTIPLLSQTKTVVRGKVMDSATRMPIPFATILFDGWNTGTVTDTTGNFYLQTNMPVARIQVSCVGYRTVFKKIEADRSQSITVYLGLKSNVFKEVVIKPKKYHYRNKGNPAVELMQKVIAHKVKNRSGNFNFMQCKKYTKIVFGISNVTDKMEARKSLKKVKFLFNNIDTTIMVGQKILPLYINEILSDYYIRSSPAATKEIMIANKKIRYADFIDDIGLMHFINYMYQDIDIYDENITLFTNKFMSPVAVLAPSFYHFFIIDTMQLNGLKFARVEFVPRNSKDLLFQGNMYIALDSTYAVEKVDMTVGKQINLNWVKNLRVAEDFQKINDSLWILTTDNIYADFKIGKNANTGIFGQKSVVYKKPDINRAMPSKFYSGDKLLFKEDSITRDKAFWLHNRPVDLTVTESNIYKDIDSVKRISAYKRDMAIAGLLGIGYLELGSVELGSMYSLYSYNGVEGNRFRIGGETTDAFSKKILLSGYGAYGLMDRTYKYGGGANYSFTNYNVYHFPDKTLSFNYSFDTHFPGEDLPYFQPDNLLLSVKRGPDNKIFYERTVNTGFLDEFPNHFSFDIYYVNSIITPGGVLDFLQYNISDNGTTNVSYLQKSEFNLLLRYAQNEKTYQKKSVRVPITTYPTFELNYSQGIRDFVGGQYTYEKIYGSFLTRLSLAPLGFTDIFLEGGKLFGTVPYPLLFIHRANQTYIYDENSYNLMNFLEFTSDRYIALNIDHSFYGFFFNRIPLLRRLNWREGFSFKILYGGISSSNNPSDNHNTILFPFYSTGIPVTYTLSNIPYIEGSIAIMNIFKIIRIDIVRRFTYLNNPYVSAWGLRAKFKIDF